VVSPDTGTTRNIFDNAGNLEISRDARDYGTTYRFDAAQRVIKNGGSTFEYGRDGSSATGRLIAMADESGKSSVSVQHYHLPT
jgi:hypothetical protein